MMYVYAYVSYLIDVEKYWGHYTRPNLSSVCTASEGPGSSSESRLSALTVETAP